MRVAALLAGKPPPDRFPIFRVAVVGHHPTAVAAGRLDLLGRRVGRHQDGGGHRQQVARERDRLGMVAGRKGDHTGPPPLGIELRDRVVGAAELERADPLQVLALEEHGSRRAGGPPCATSSPACAAPRLRAARPPPRHHGSLARPVATPVRRGSAGPSNLPKYRRYQSMVAVRACAALRIAGRQSIISRTLTRSPGALIATAATTFSSMLRTGTATQEMP